MGINLITSENGYRIERDKLQQFEVVTLDANGKPAARQGLVFQLYKLNWRWWWDQADDYTTNYLSSRYATRVLSNKFNTVAGKGKVNFEIKSPDWGRYIAVFKDPVSGHSASKVFYTSWYGDSDDNALGSTLLQISTDKEEYAVGEKMTITMRGSLEGQALISLENGSSVLDNTWIKTEREWTSYTLDVTPEMAPNVYVHATLLQPHGQTVNDLPIRLYGITNVKVFDPETKLAPELSMPDKLAPNEPVTITVSESNKRPMAYTLAIVDEGLLDITNFQTPDPWNHFFTREAIGVKTWDMYKDVIGAYGGKLERLLAIGGGEGGLDDQDKQQENRFKPVVQFMGPFYLEAGKTKQHTFTMPQYIGSVKTMLVAGMNGAYGSAEKATPVVKPLMVLGTLPRVVGPGEKVSLPVNVFKYEDQIKNAKITVEASGVLSVSGQNNKTIQLSGSGGTIYYDLQVADKLGTGKVVITASSGKETATHEINMLSRSPNNPQTTVSVTPVEQGKTITATGKLFGMEGTNTVTLELASIPPINLERRLGYLIRYPHGCIEQTVSSVFPQLFLDDVTELSSEQKVKIENNIRVAIDKLKRFQSTGGGLSYWPGGGDPNSWGTTYAYHFLVEAQKKGYLVSSDMMNRLKQFQSSQARNWTMSVDYQGTDLIQSYRLFTLAIAGYPELGAMNRLRSTSGISEQSVFKLAAAYGAIGQKEAARSLMANRNLSSIKKQPYEYYYYTYGSFERDMAILLESYVYMGDKTESFKVLKEISDRLSDDRWMSTQATAYCLLAVAKYVESNQSDKSLNARISYGSTTTEWTSTKAVYQSEIPPGSLESLKITNQGEATMFATVTITGTPRPGDEPVESNSLNVSVRYVDINGRSLNPDSIRLGESFDILIDVKNNYSLGGVRDIALTHILPSGWEIQNDRLNDQESEGFSPFDFQDIRDDRIYTYFYLGRNDKKTFKVSATAAYPGQYYMPGIQAEAMYNATISAKNAGRWIRVSE